MLQWGVDFQCTDLQRVKSPQEASHETEAARHLHAVSRAGQDGPLPSTSSRAPAIRCQSAANMIRNAICIDLA